MRALIATCAVLLLTVYLAAVVRGGASAGMAWAAAAGTIGILAAFMLLGARRGGRIARTVQVAVLVVALLLAVGFGIALGAPPVTAATPRLLGLPWPTALMVYGVGLLPLGILPLVYALTFRRTVLSADDLAAVRTAGGTAAPAPPP